jgi:hypothetical protein
LEDAAAKAVETAAGRGVRGVGGANFDFGFELRSRQLLARLRGGGERLANRLSTLVEEWQRHRNPERELIERGRRIDGMVQDDAAVMGVAETHVDIRHAPGLCESDRTLCRIAQVA